jgi:UMF1 family MFS transporter
VRIPKLTRSGRWILYDWANSAFALSVLAALFPLLFRSEWSIGSGDTTTVRLGIANGLIGLFVALLSPLLASVSSQSGHRKSYLILWGGIAMSATALMTFVPHGSWFLALSLFAIARVGFQFSNLFYDSMLMDVSSPARYHRVSSLGFAFGYIGGAILFLCNLLLVLWAQKHGNSAEVLAQRFGFIMVALWWFLFSIPLWKLKIKRKDHEDLSSFARAVTALKQVKETARLIVRDRNILLFLIAYWFYIDGVHTVILMATDFGLALGFSMGGLFTALLLVQVIAFPSSLLTGFLAEKFRAKRIIAFSIVVYILITGVGGLTMNRVHHFTWFAIITGMVQGGIQALSRSLFSTIIPREHATEMFGVYNMVGRFAVILGPILFALAKLVVLKFPFLAGGETVRVGMSSLSILFLIGLFTLFRVREPRHGELSVER